MKVRESTTPSRLEGWFGFGLTMLVILFSLISKYVPIESLILIALLGLVYIVLTPSGLGATEVVLGFLALCLIAVLVSISQYLLPVIGSALVLLLMTHRRSQDFRKVSKQKLRQFAKCLVATLLVWDVMIALSGGLTRIISTQLSGDGFNFIYSYKHIQHFHYGIIGYYSQGLRITAIGSSTLFQLFMNLAVSPFSIINHKASARIPLANLESSITSIFLLFSFLFAFLFSQVRVKTSLKKYASLFSFLTLVGILVVYWSPFIYGLVLANSFFSTVIAIFILVAALIIASEPYFSKTRILLATGLTMAMIMTWSLLSPLVLVLALLSTNLPFRVIKNRWLAFIGLIFFQILFMAYSLSGAKSKSQLFSTGGFPKPQSLLMFSVCLTLFYLILRSKRYDLGLVILLCSLFLFQLLLAFIEKLGFQMFRDDFSQHQWVTKTYYFSKALWIVCAALIIYCLKIMSDIKVFGGLVIVLTLAIIQTSYTSILWNRPLGGFVNQQEEKVLLSSVPKSKFMFYNSGTWAQDINSNFAAALVWENYTGNSGIGKRRDTTTFPIVGSFGYGSFDTDPVTQLCKGVIFLLPKGVIYTKDPKLNSEFSKICNAPLPPGIQISNLG